MDATDTSAAVAPRRAAASLTLGLYLTALVALGLYALAGRPITALDNDLWFHLSHGRYLVAEGEIPDDSYFSFREPPAAGVNYYWLFEATVYGVFSLGGYPGLIVLRTLLFALFLGTIFLYLRSGESSWPRRLWLVFVFGLYLTHAVPKYLLVRPHTLSYLFIALFLYLLEVRPRQVWLLPVLGILWVNFHGIEYPVLLLIAGAYFGETVLDRLRTRDRDAASRAPLLLALCLTVATVFLTPHGARLLRLPFTSTEYVSSFISEMARLPLRQLFSYELTPEGFPAPTQTSLVLLLALFAAVGGLVRGRLRLSHAVLFVGGLVLLTKGARFTHEFTLLALPLLKSDGVVPRDFLPSRRTWSATAAILAATLLLATPFLYLVDHLGKSTGTWPLSLENLPHGTAAFLRHVDASGKVMNNPNLGAYLLWELYPRYRIYMDLEVAFLFDERDMFELTSAYYDRTALARFLARYRPEVIAAPIAAGAFQGLIAEHPVYRPVFFDDTGVVYLDGRRFPAIAAAYELRFVDPYALAATRFSALAPAELAGCLAELERVLAVDPRISAANQSAAIVYNLERRYDLALERTARVIAKEPRLARGHAIRGDALSGLGRLDEAVAAYRRAIRVSTEEDEQRAISRSLAATLAAAGRFSDAYEAFERAVGRFNIEASYQDLYRLGALAAESGRPRQAERMLRFAALKVPPEAVEEQRRIAEALAAVTADRTADR